MQGPALRATGRNTLSDAQWSAPLGRATEASAGTVHEKMETPLSDAQWFVPLGKATEASACTVHEKMETPLSDAQWVVLLGRTTEASAGTVHENMETPLSDAQWFVPLGRATEVSAVMVRNCFLDLFLRMTEASRERSVWFLVRFSGFGRKVFLGSGSQNDGSVARNAPFLVSSMIFWTWSEGVSWIWFSE